MTGKTKLSALTPRQRAALARDLMKRVEKIYEEHLELQAEIQALKRKLRTAKQASERPLGRLPKKGRAS